MTRPTQNQALARNPLLAERQAQNDALPTRTPAPTLFASGDVPPYLASGNPPAELLKLPWEIRHYAAKADQAEFARLMAAYAGNPEADLEVKLFEPAACADPGNDDYRARFQAWLLGR